MRSTRDPDQDPAAPDSGHLLELLDESIPKVTTCSVPGPGFHQGGASTDFGFLLRISWRCLEICSITVVENTAQEVVQR